MGKFLKTGKVVIILAGRYAGRKAVIVNTFEKGVGERKFGTVLVAGLDRYPRTVTRAMGKTKVAKRSKVKPFIKFVNQNHIMPTRYQVDIGDALKKRLTDSETNKVITERTNILAARKDVKVMFEDRYKTQDAAAIKNDRVGAGVSYFFKKLRF